MVLQQRPDQVPDDTEPPFLQEPTITVGSGPSRQPMDLVVDFVYRWRLALALGVIPVLLAALALSVDPAEPDDPLVGGQDDEQSSMEAFLSGFGVEHPQTASAIGSTTASTVSPNERSAAPLGADDESAPPLPPTSPTTVPSSTTTAPPTTPPPTTTPPATEPPTTEPPTTEPPTTIVETTTAPPTTAQTCMVSVRRRAPLRAEPDDDSDRVERARRGTFPGLAVQEGWIQIDYDGTVGWIEDQFVNGVEGNC